MTISPPPAESSSPWVPPDPGWRDAPGWTPPTGGALQPFPPTTTTAREAGAFLAVLRRFPGVAGGRPPRRGADLAYSCLCLLVLLGYLGVIEATRRVPLSPHLEVPLAVTGLLLNPVLAFRLLRSHRVRRRPPAPRRLLAAAPLLLLFAVLAGTALVECVRGTIDPESLKLYEWKTSKGAYYHRYTAGGPGEPWSPIGRDRYVTEVGSNLRNAASFGVFCLCFAFLTSEAARLQRRAGDVRPHNGLGG